MNEIIKLENIYQSYGKNQILKDINFTIEKRQILGLLGESGSGKSTIAKVITGISPPNKGKINLLGKSLYPKKSISRKELYKNIQMIYQDSTNSFDPKMTIGPTIDRGQKNLLGISMEEAKSNTMKMLKRVGLDPDMAYYSRPTDLSGGECQRASIARALTIRPKLLICDEATSSLDTSVASNIVNLLLDLKKEFDMSILFISHNYALSTLFCDQILVIEKGSIVERLDTENIEEQISHPYTKLLFELR
ncbi:ABC transporter ATP-binding protein [Anaerococcus degeneri]|uniref:ATP-binding cassette domain-containing protein n=1 Tax=Anaerococcus degeneri TaxID=361500 RepID=A0ABS7YYS2_9FIRM|nr:ATP-binding cassette domain-containing protein [Anaerococcus degeneri]MBP2014668.1 peptide/nickel transport system ATP-binding protein [Anaerococcus degeneri]MCA2096880.1 ATP-binding cassette domain-containing protein [Anaerococcus degeneri]